MKLRIKIQLYKLWCICLALSCSTASVNVHTQYLRLWNLDLDKSPQRVTREQTNDSTDVSAFTEGLFPGPCLHEGDSFCTRRVANSMCSSRKNECFCRPGFVSIQESYGITCKTLLTNLKCQVDDDCTHVTNSACHPGAGLCACPGGTIHVPQYHACFPSAENVENAFCQQCRQINGVCYRNAAGINTRVSAASVGEFEHTDGPIDESLYESLQDWLNRSSFGCKCPYNTGMPLAIPKMHLPNYGNSSGQDMVKLRGENGALSPPHLTDVTSYLPQWSFCKAILVDIGQYCNQIDVVCRAKNAVCRRSSRERGHVREGKPFQCRCLDGYIPVFQHHLGYQECFLRLPSNHTSCEQCIKTGGLCYMMNEQAKRSMGCLCPNNRSPTSLAQSDYTVEDQMRSTVTDDSHLEMHTTSKEIASCAESLSEVSCYQHHVELCYKPPRHPPYSTLSEHLINRQAMAFVSDTRTGFAFHNSCTLNPATGRRGSTEGDMPVRGSAGFGDVSDGSVAVWCIYLDWRSEPENPPCGLRVTQYMSGHLYSGYLAILTDPDLSVGHVNNLMFRFTCKTNKDIPHQVPGQVFEHRLPDSMAPPRWDNLPWSPTTPKTLFDVRNRTGHALETVFASTPIRLHAQLDRNSGPYKFMQVEDCYVAEVPMQDREFQFSEEYPIIRKGCLTQAIEHQLVNSDAERGFTPQGNSWFQAPTNYETNLFLAAISPQGSRCLYNRTNCSPDVPSPWSLHQSNTLSEMDPTNRNQVPTAFTHLTPHSEYKVHRLEYKCIFRVCTGQAWCSWPNACGTSGSEIDPTPRTTFLPPVVRFLVRSVHLNVVQLISTDPESAQTKANSPSACRSMFCTAGLPLLLILSLVGLLTCLMGVLGLLLARRYRQRYPTLPTHRPRTTNKSSRQERVHRIDNPSFSPLWHPSTMTEPTPMIRPGMHGELKLGQPRPLDLGPIYDGLRPTCLLEDYMEHSDRFEKVDSNEAHKHNHIHSNNIMNHLPNPQLYMTLHAYANPISSQRSPSCDETWTRTLDRKNACVCHNPHLTTVMGTEQPILVPMPCQSEVVYHHTFPGPQISPDRDHVKISQRAAVAASTAWGHTEMNPTVSKHSISNGLLITEQTEVFMPPSYMTTPRVDSSQNFSTCTGMEMDIKSIS